MVWDENPEWGTGTKRSYCAKDGLRSKVRENNRGDVAPSDISKTEAEEKIRRCIGKTKKRARQELRGVGQASERWRSSEGRNAEACVPKLVEKEERGTFEKAQCPCAKSPNKETGDLPEKETGCREKNDKLKVTTRSIRVKVEELSVQQGWAVKRKESIKHTTKK